MSTYNERNMETRVTLLEAQMGRIVADIESEKGTRKRLNSDLWQRFDKFEENQRRTERILYMGLGALGVLQFTIPLLVGWLKGG